MSTSPPGLVQKKKRTALEASLCDWYSRDAERQKQLDRIVKGNAEFSLREIDWFVTNYCARNPVVYTLPSSEKVVDVHNEYREVLRSFHKRQFDAFKRKGADPSEAALRQMNFFRWAIENGVVDYVRLNADAIKEDMIRMRKKQRTTSSSFEKKEEQQPLPTDVVDYTTSDALLAIPSFITPPPYPL
jgi:hypothetical protein